MSDALLNQDVCPQGQSKYGLVAVVAVTLAAAVPVVYFGAKAFVQWRVRRCVNHEDLNLLRSNFSAFFPAHQRGTTPPGHTHGFCASHRTEAGRTMGSFSRLLGYVPFYVQLGPRQQRDGELGNLVDHWTCDLKAMSQYDPVPSRAVKIFIDSEHYLQEPSDIADGYPTLIYTTSPRYAGDSTKEFSYLFRRDGSLFVRVSGGATYPHHVWDYSRDDVTITSWNTVTSYTIDKRQVSDNHQIVLLTPILRMRWLDAWVWKLGDYLSWVPKYNTLKRLAPVVPTVNKEWTLGEKRPVIMEVMDCQAHYFTVGLTDHHGHIEIPVEAYTHLVAYAATSKSAPTPNGIASIIAGGDKERLVELTHQAYLLKAVITALAPSKPQLLSIADVEHYKKNPYTHEDKSETMHALCHPISDNTVGPYNCKSSDADAASRLTSFRPGPTTTQVKALVPDHERFFDDYLDILFPSSPNLTPCEIDEVYLRQARPSQQAIITQAVEQPEDSVPHKMMMKAEAMVLGKTVRPIIIAAPRTKVAQAQFMYPVADYILEHFGEVFVWSQNPAQLSANLMDFITFQSPTGAYSTDEARCDGRKSPCVRTMEVRFLMRAFAHHYIVTCLETHSATYAFPAKSTNGVSFTVDFEQGSGFGDTTLFNTVFQNHYPAYECARQVGWPARKAFFEVGRFLGDDGVVNKALPAACLERSYANYNHVLEIEYLTNTIHFAGRYFQVGGISCIADVPRTLAKLHITHDASAAASREARVARLYEKFSCLYLTDFETPVIHDLLVAFEEHGVVFPARPVAGDSWYARFDADVQFVVEDREWAEDAVETMLENLRVDWTAFENLCDAIVARGFGALIDLPFAPFIPRAHTSHVNVEAESLVPEPDDDPLFTPPDKLDPPGSMTPQGRANAKARTRLGMEVSADPLPKSPPVSPVDWTPPRDPTLFDAWYTRYVAACVRSGIRTIASKKDMAARRDSQQRPKKRTEGKGPTPTLNGNHGSRTNSDDTTVKRPATVRDSAINGNNGSYTNSDDTMACGHLSHDPRHPAHREAWIERCQLCLYRQEAIRHARSKRLQLLANTLPRSAPNFARILQIAVLIVMATFAAPTFVVNGGTPPTENKPPTLITYITTPMSNGNRNSRKPGTEVSVVVDTSMDDKKASSARPTSRPRRAKGSKQVEKTKKKAASVGTAYSREAVKAGKRMLNWSKLLARPLELPYCQCPVNYNIVDSPSIMPFTTTCDVSFTVDANTARELILFPGHTSEMRYDVVDPESFHQNLQEINGGQLWSAGPLRTVIGGGSRSPFALALSPQAGNTIFTLPLASTSTYGAIPWTNTSAMVASDSAGHLRWKLIAAGIKWTNKTEHLDKGGAVRTVQPSFEFMPAAIWTEYNRFKSHRLLDDLNGEISWIPRKEDLAFWHTFVPAPGVTDRETTSRSAGIRILFDAPSKAQVYSIQATCHWELAGNSIQDSSTPTAPVAAHRATVEDSLNNLANGPYDASDAPGIFAQAAEAATSGLHYLANQGMKVAAHAAVRAVDHAMRSAPVAPRYSGDTPHRLRFGDLP